MDVLNPVPVTRIAIPIGDPNGIGPEIALKTAIAMRDEPRVCITLFGPQAVLEATANQLGVTDALTDLRCVFTPAMPAGTHQPGVVCADAGVATIRALDDRRFGRQLRRVGRLRDKTHAVDPWFQPSIRSSGS